jgi:hypothetical protein
MHLHSETVRAEAPSMTGTSISGIAPRIVVDSKSPLRPGGGTQLTPAAAAAKPQLEPKGLSSNPVRAATIQSHTRGRSTFRTGSNVKVFHRYLRHMPTIEEYASIYNLTSTSDGKINFAGFREIFDSCQVLLVLLELQHRKRLKVLVPDVWLPIAPAMAPDTVKTVLGDQHQNARSSVCSDSVWSERVARDMGRRDTTMYLRADPNLPPPPSSTSAQKLSEPKPQGESESIYNLQIVNEQAKARQCLPRDGLMPSPIVNQMTKATPSDNVTQVNTDRRSTKSLGFWSFGDLSESSSAELLSS